MGKGNSKLQDINTKKVYQLEKLYCDLNRLKSESDKFQAKAVFWKGLLNTTYYIPQSVKNCRHDPKEFKLVLILHRSLMNFHDRVREVVGFSDFYQAYVRAFLEKDVETQLGSLRNFSAGFRHGDEFIKHNELIQMAMENSMSDFVFKIIKKDKKGESDFSGLDRFLEVVQGVKASFKAFEGVRTFSMGRSAWKFKALIDNKLSLRDFLTIFFDKKIKISEFNNEKEKVKKVFEACCVLEGITEYQKAVNLVTRFEEKFNFESRIDQFVKIEHNIDIITRLEPKIEKLDILDRFFEEKGIGVDPRDAHASHYAFLNFEQLDYCLSNSLKFSRKKEALDDSKNDFSFNELDLKFDLESSIKEALCPAITSLNERLKRLEDSASIDAIRSFSTQFEELKMIFSDFGDFLEDKIFSSLHFVDRIEFGRKQIRGKQTLVEKAMQTRPAGPIELNFDSFFELRKGMKKKLLETFFHQLIKKPNISFQNQATIHSSKTGPAPPIPMDSADTDFYKFHCHKNRSLKNPKIFELHSTSHEIFSLINQNKQIIKKFKKSQ